MELTGNEKQVTLEVLEKVVENAHRDTRFDGNPVYNTDDDLLFSFSGEDMKALKRIIKKLQE